MMECAHIYVSFSFCIELVSHCTRLFAGVKLERLTGCLDFMNVSFRYSSRKMVPILENVSFSIKANEVVAIVSNFSIYLFI